MFYDLPIEIITEIYEFDNTYKCIFDKVIEDIQQYKIYESKDVYYVYDTQCDIMYCTDSLSRPTWICSSFHVTKEQMKDIILRKKLVQNKTSHLEYDIRDFQFQSEGNELRYLS